MSLWPAKHTLLPHHAHRIHAASEHDIADNDNCADCHHRFSQAAVSLGADYKECAKGFMRLKPNTFHMSDGMLSEEKDEHIGVGGGMVTVETPRVKISLDEDEENLYILKNVIRSI